MIWISVKIMKLGYYKDNSPNNVTADDIDIIVPIPKTRVMIAIW